MGQYVQYFVSKCAEFSSLQFYVYFKKWYRSVNVQKPDEQPYLKSIKIIALDSQTNELELANSNLSFNYN